MMRLPNFGIVVVDSEGGGCVQVGVASGDAVGEGVAILTFPVIFG
jgi:hypothetical protein